MKESGLIQKHNESKNVSKAGASITPPSSGISFVDQAIQKKENNTGLPDQLKSGVESLSGIDMSDVKVHYNSSQPAQLNAHAYAQGNHIHVAPGQEKHLPHEAWHVVQQKQGRVKPTMQLKGKVNINDDAGLEKEADVMGAYALSKMPEEKSIDPNDGKIQKKVSDTIQRRVSVGEYTIMTPKNAKDLSTYLPLKIAHDRAEEAKNASREQREPRVINNLKVLAIDYLQKPFELYYHKFSPPVTLEQINAKLMEWADAKSPAEVLPDKSGKIPLVSTQDNHFNTVKDLFFALVNNIRAEHHKDIGEKTAFEILGQFSFYEPVIIKILEAIEAEMNKMPKQIRQQIIMAGYASSLISPTTLELQLPAIIQKNKYALEKLFISLNAIHSFIITTKMLAKPERKDIAAVMGDRHNKYSPIGPEVELARRRGYSVWSGFSGSTADILNLGRLYHLPPHEIHKLALLTAAFFQFLPTSKNPTHTFHEVMAVASKYFGVPYDPQNPMHGLPHAQKGSAPRVVKQDIVRTGKMSPETREIEMSKLISLHDVPRKGVNPSNITNIRDKISKEGYNVEYPVSATLLPNGDFMITGGHHRIAAMNMLGQNTTPTKVYHADKTDKVKLAYFIGIARITGKYYHEWEPSLSEPERSEVNKKLKDWKENNPDQVKYDFDYKKAMPLRSKL
jgi:hypothetical protein